MCTLIWQRNRKLQLPLCWFNHNIVIRIPLSNYKQKLIIMLNNLWIPLCVCRSLIFFFWSETGIYLVKFTGVLQCNFSFVLFINNTRCLDKIEVSWSDTNDLTKNGVSMFKWKNNRTIDWHFCWQDYKVFHGTCSRNSGPHLSDCSLSW